MPIIKFHVGGDHPQPHAVKGMAQTLRQACIDLLRAHPDAVQLVIIPGCSLLCGPPCYVEVLYRGQEHRTAEVMARFMRLLEAQVLAVWGQVPRIRCMAFHPSDLHASN